MDERGWYRILVLILIFFIIIGAAWFVWGYVLPFFENWFGMNQDSLELKIQPGSFTVYDAEHNFTFVQVQRGSDNVKLIGLEFVFVFESKEVSYMVYDFPGQNQLKSYGFDFEKDKISGVPEKVLVSGIFSKGKSSRDKGAISAVLPKEVVELDEKSWERVREVAKNYSPEN